MKVEKFKVLLYLKKSEPDKSGKAPIMGRITVNRSMAQFSCKLSCRPELWNPRESRLNGKSKEAVDKNLTKCHHLREGIVNVPHETVRLQNHLRPVHTTERFTPQNSLPVSIQSLFEVSKGADIVMS